MKYGSQRHEFRGRSFASQLEASVYGLLILEERAGLVRDIECQVEVRLTAAGVIYKPDFRFFDVKLDCVAYAEAKGFETGEWRIKLRLWRYYGLGPLRIYMGSAARPFLTEVVIPKGGTDAVE